MKKLILISIFLFSFFVLNVSAGVKPQSVIIQSSVLFQAYNEMDANGDNVTGINTLKLDQAEAERYFQSYNSITINNFPINNSVKGNIILNKKRPVFDANTKFLSGGVTGEEIVKPPEVFSFTGYIEGKPGSKVYLFFINHKMFSLINYDDTNYILAPEPESGLENNYVFVPENELYFNRQFNYEAIANDVEELLNDKYKYSKAKTQSGELLELELALETDTEFFKKTGGTLEKAQTYAIALMSLISSIYEEHINVTIYLTWLKCWTDNPSDPYDANGDPYLLRDLTKEYWKENYSDVERDLFHVITADPSGAGQGGFGYYNALCSQNGDYGFSTSSIKGFYDLPTYAYTYDVQIVAHEIGHNFNARHTHSCYYGDVPLDTCVVGEGIDGGCLEEGQQAKPNLGSIMSYCGGINNVEWGAYRVRLIFLPEVAAVMRQTAEESECLALPENPVINLIEPKGISVFNAGDNINIKWTSARVNFVNISYTTNNGSEWLEVAGNLPASDMDYNWTAPEICESNITIRISDALIDEVADTSLFPFSIFFKNPDGLLAYYAFNGNPKNEVCGFPDAESINDPVKTTDRNETINSAYLFDGSNYFIAKDANFNFDNFTAVFWFNTSTNSGVETILGTNWLESAKFHVYIWNGSFGGSIWNKGTGEPIQIWHGYIDANKWYQGALSFDGNNLKIYLDGNLSNTLEATATILQSITNLYIGSRKDTEFFNGKLDDIRFYNRALSDNEIQTLYQNDLTGIENKHWNVMDDFSIYPNPANDFLNIRCNNDNGALSKISVLDCLGNTIGTFNHNFIINSEYCVGISGLTAGVYFIIIQSGSKTTSYKFIKLM
ncbi:LamG-like jellyroll fold domain-containing protein [Bacteroidota bacterium]